MCLIATTVKHDQVDTELHSMKLVHDNHPDASTANDNDEQRQSPNYLTGPWEIYSSGILDMFQTDFTEQCMEPFLRTWPQLTHCGLVTLYVDTGLGQH